MCSFRSIGEERFGCATILGENEERMWWQIAEGRLFTFDVPCQRPFNKHAPFDARYGTNYEEARRVDVGRIQAARLWFLIMDMVLFHLSVTLLLFVTNNITSFAAAVNIEGEILHSLRMNLIDPNNVMQSWDPNLPSPCTWFHVTCDSDGSVVRIDLGNAALSGQLVPQLGQLKNLQYLKLYGNNLSGPIFDDLGNLKSLVSLDLYSNCLSGFIPHTLGKLRKLRFLRLNNNNLTGSIPMSLTHVTGLQILDLSNNHLSGPVPENGSFSLLNLISSNNLDLCGRVIGNPCPGSHFPPPFNPSSPGGIPSRTVTITGVAAGAALLFSASALGLAWWFQQIPQEQFFDVPAEEDSEICLRQLKRFYLQELQVATNSFSDINVLCRGESSEVYKGCLADGTLVAVKRLQGDKPATMLMFQTEIKVIGMAVHRNISTLYGFCTTPTNFFLVYPYMANGSVASCLRERAPDVPPLDWATRKQIALGAARGLSYLHVHCDPKIIHLNVKLSNILLDEKFEAIVGDFRIAEFMDYKRSHMRSVVKGTSGYVAPEYTCRGKFSEKCDVYAYGMMLLELTTGQKIHDLLQLAKEDGLVLPYWVKNLLEQKKLDMMVDPDIFIEPEVEHMIQIAILCSQVSPTHRPNMSEVVRMLEGDNLLKTWESLTPEIGAIPASQYLWTMDSSDNMDMEKSDVQLSGNKTSRIGLIIGGVAAGVTSLFATLAIGFTWFRQWKLQEKLYHFKAADDPEVHLGHLKRFSLRELRVATDNFSNINIIGRGGFGKVYMGRLADGSLVAVKRLREEHSRGGELQFQTEIKMISVAVHRNLLRLQGFCMTSTERLIVYPYMANGSVASCLRKHRQNEPPLDWPTRRRIALGSAKGLDYLHDHCESKIIHRDVKAANILLDEEFEAVVGDFGLAKLMGAEDTHVTTALRGTIGYIAPEYLASGKASEKTDVFGYGITLLELITGQSAFDLVRQANGGNTMLLDWVKGILKENNLEMLVDQNLQNKYIYSEVEQLIQVALICTQYSEIYRPKMSEVLRLLEGDGLAEKWEEWQTVENLPADELSGNFEWIVDSTENLPADELSGPR